MDTNNIIHIDDAIGQALAKIERQRELVLEFISRGYDTTAPTAILSSLLVDLHRLERQRREIAARLKG